MFEFQNSSGWDFVTNSYKPKNNLEKRNITKNCKAWDSIWFGIWYSIIDLSMIDHIVDKIIETCAVLNCMFETELTEIQ